MCAALPRVTTRDRADLLKPDPKGQGWERGAQFLVVLCEPSAAEPGLLGIGKRKGSSPTLPLGCAEAHGLIERFLA